MSTIPISSVRYNTTPEVDAVGALPFEGNLIPQAWYTTLTLPSGRPDLVAITLLADIVYWYRPVVVRDPASGQILGRRKKFKADMLQRSYQAFAAQFGFTKRQVREALGRLEQQRIIRKEFRHLDTPYGRCANVLFVAPIPATVQAITCGVTTPPPASTTDVLRSNVTRVTPSTTLLVHHIDPISQVYSGDGSIGGKEFLWSKCTILGTFNALKSERNKVVLGACPRITVYGPLIHARPPVWGYRWGPLLPPP